MGMANISLPCTLNSHKLQLLRLLLPTKNFIHFALLNFELILRNLHRHSQFHSTWSNQPETLYVYLSVFPWRHQHTSSSEGLSQYDLNLSCLQLSFYLLCDGENVITPWEVGLNTMFGRKRSEINLRHLQRLCFPLLPFWQTLWREDCQYVKSWLIWFSYCLNKPAVIKQMCIQFTF